MTKRKRWSIAFGFLSMCALGYEKLIIEEAVASTITQNEQQKEVKEKTLKTGREISGKIKPLDSVLVDKKNLGDNEPKKNADNLNNINNIDGNNKKVNTILTTSNNKDLNKDLTLDAFIDYAISEQAKLKKEENELTLQNKFTILTLDLAENNKISSLNVNEVSNFNSNLSSSNSKIKNELNVEEIKANAIGINVEMSNVDKVKKMQKLASYIADTYNVSLIKAENIVYSTFTEASKKNLEPTLVLSVISIESMFKQFSKSSAGAVGLTQVMPKVHKARIAEHKVDIWSIQGNIKVGTDILKDYIKLAGGNMKKALQMYNGSSDDRKFNYSNKVMNKMQTFVVAAR